MTYAERLRGVAQIAEQNPDDLWAIRWRLVVIWDDLDRDIRKHDRKFVDEVLETVR